MTTQTEKMILVPEATVKLALEALKLGDTVFYPQTSIAIAAIEGLLAQLEHSATHGKPKSSLADVIRAEPTELIHKWRVIEIVKDYTTPPQRTWFGLTDEQFQAIKDSLSRQEGWDGDGWDLALKEAIEAKLKEKNT